MLPAKTLQRKSYGSNLNNILNLKFRKRTSIYVNEVKKSSMFSNEQLERISLLKTDFDERDDLLETSESSVSEDETRFDINA